MRETLILPLGRTVQYEGLNNWLDAKLPKVRLHAEVVYRYFGEFRRTLQKICMERPSADASDTGC